MSSAVTVVQTVRGSASAAVNSAPVRVSGYPVSFQTVAPQGLGTIQGSNDRQTWITLTNIENSDLGTTLGSTQDEIKERPEWVRLLVATASGASLFRVLWNIRKDNT